MFHLYLWSPLSPPPEIPPPKLHVSRQFAHACIYLSSSCLLSVRFCLFAVSPVAPVVTLCPPVCLTGGRCHASHGVLASVPMFGGLPPPQPMRLAVLGSGVGGGA